MNTAAGRTMSDKYNEEIRLHTLEVAIAPVLKPSLSGLPGASAREHACKVEVPRVCMLRCRVFIGRFSPGRTEHAALMRFRDRSCHSCGEWARRNDFEHLPSGCFSAPCCFSTVCSQCSVLVGVPVASVPCITHLLDAQNGGEKTVTRALKRTNTCLHCGRGCDVCGCQTSPLPPQAPGCRGAVRLLGGRVQRSDTQATHAGRRQGNKAEPDSAECVAAGIT